MNRLKNKKAQVGGIISLILVVILCVWIVGMFAFGIENGLKFDRTAGSYCKLAYDSSDIDKKIDYYDRCLIGLHTMDLTGHSVWFFKKPNNELKELYSVADSLQTRMYHLKDMDRSSFEYQTGLAQVEEEIAYFIGRESGDNSFSNSLNSFERAYCFTRYLDWWC